jgi:hypothetical protein
MYETRTRSVSAGASDGAVSNCYAVLKRVLSRIPV